MLGHQFNRLQHICIRHQSHSDQHPVKFCQPVGPLLTMLRRASNTASALVTTSPVPVKRPHNRATELSS